MPSRATRRLLVWLVAACVLFAQSAAIAYACTLDRVDSAPAASAAPCPGHVADTSSDTNAGDANLCQVHCQTPTTADPGVTPPMAAAVDAAPIVLATVPLAVYRVVTAPTPRGTPPAVLRLTSRLLI